MPTDFGCKSALPLFVGPCFHSSLWNPHLLMLCIRDGGGERVLQFSDYSGCQKEEFRLAQPVKSKRASVQGPCFVFTDERLGHHALQTLANLSCLVRGSLSSADVRIQFQLSRCCSFNLE